MSRRTQCEVDKEIKELIASDFFKPKVREKVTGSWFDPKALDGISPKTPIELSINEWLDYGLRAINRFHETVSGRNIPNWDQVLFRNESQFISGAFSLFPQVWLILINAIPAENKAEIYHIIHSGLNLFDNLKRISREEAVIHKGVAIKTHFCTNPDNAVLGVQNHQKVPEARIYPRKVLIPVVASGERKGQALKFTNPKGVIDKHEFVKEYLRKSAATGALEHVPKSKMRRVDQIDWEKECEKRPEDRFVTPLLTAALIIVPKKGPEQFRVCYDGSILKDLEAFKQPCKLDMCK